MAAFKKILFPTDFSANADKAVAHAIRLADFNGGELMVQHVVGDYFERNPHWATLFDLNELHKFMDGYVAAHVQQTVCRENGKLRIRPIISKGRTVDEITALAEREQVDLIVMGSAKGVVTNSVIRNTNRPVLAVSSKRLKGDDANVGSINRILVATDFSEHSKRVMRYAFDLKRSFNAAIYLLYVIETSRAIEFAIRQGHYIDTIERMRDWATNQLVNLTPDEFIGDPTVFRLVESGSAGVTIADVGFEIGADLTILGTHEYGTVHKRLVKTTTEKVLTKTSTPVLALKL